MDIISYIGKRLGQGIFVVIGISIVIFVISRIVPGDPARLALGPQAPKFAVDQLRKEMHLDKPLPVQYYYWIKGVIRGDFGISLNTKRPVKDDVVEFLPATLELAIFSGLIFVILAVILGILATKYRDTWIDNIIRAFSYVGIAVPAFVVAIILLLLFGYVWRIMPVLGRLSTEIPIKITGFVTIDSLLTGDFGTFFDALKHLILPAFALALGPLFQEARILRAALIDNLNKEYISVATGFGLPSNLIMSKYLLKPSLIAVVSVMGLDFAALMGNAFLVEKIFNWPGISRYGVNAMLNKDLNAISAVIVVFGIIFVVVNIIVDIIIALLDPRIRLGGTE